MQYEQLRRFMHESRYFNATAEVKVRLREDDMFSVNRGKTWGNGEKLI